MVEKDLEMIGLWTVRNVPRIQVWRSKWQLKILKKENNTLRNENTTLKIWLMYSFWIINKISFYFIISLLAFVFLDKHKM